MKIIVLNDNRASSICGAQHGLSYFIEFDEKKILLDAGPSEIAMKNARILGVDLTALDCVVLSHGHWDHGNGLRFLPQGKPLLLHPGVFQKRYKRINNQYIGLDMTEQEIRTHFLVQSTVQPVEIAHQAWFLGEIPRVIDFEVPSTKYRLENGETDSIIDDTALAFNTPKGIVVVTGCSHSGICNIILKAKELIPNRPVANIMGGFHLNQTDKRLAQTIEFFQQQGIIQLLPSHCTDPKVICHLSQFFDVKWVGSGNVFRF
jgi:7,8-dihydropterin-6-yl-methyl-4-(beta-D-ribofuranosyl)aminobenzene 5'-phosphate synthase